MSATALELLDEREEVLVFIPPVSLGYFFHLQGNITFLYAGVFFLLISTYLYQELFDEEDGFDKNVPDPISLILVYIWSLGILLDLYWLSRNLDHTNAILIILLGANLYLLASGFAGMMHIIFELLGSLDYPNSAVQFYNKLRNIR